MKKYKLSIFAPVVKRGNEYMFGITGDFTPSKNEVFTMEREQELLIERLISGEYIEEEELKHVLGEGVFEYYLKNNIIVDYEEDGTGIYSRSNAFYKLNNFGDVQSKLANKKVLILGCGGIGTHLAWNLTVLGVGEITLLDYDIVEESNLNRQLLFDRQDIGKSKTEVLKKKLTDINNNVRIDYINIKIDSVHILERECTQKKYDLILKSLDSPVEISKWLDDVCNKHKLNSISGITTGLSTLIGPTYIPNKSVGFSKIIGTEEISFDRVTGIAQSIGVTLYHIASEISIEALKILGGFGRLQYVNKICVENIFDNTTAIFTPKESKHETLQTEKYMKLLINLLLSLIIICFYAKTNFLPVLFLGFALSILGPVFIYHQAENAMKGVFVNTLLYLVLNVSIVFMNMNWSGDHLINLVLNLLISSFISVSCSILFGCILGYAIFLLKSRWKDRIYKRGARRNNTKTIQQKQYKRKAA
jgi:molybdopterin/thiamine biosynthesis adenylyltransferase